MSRHAIEICGVGKRYELGAAQRKGETFRELVAGVGKGALRRITAPKTEAPAKRETLWALKDVSFSVDQGEVVGIIGRNGAGKSTLLKVLSRITEPSAGYIDLWGRVGSLLEVGTGFHPELSGRENIFLNGAILGMRRGEIERKFDEIVAFAEVERFIDTAVKHYSSGMYLRLAFAVAAHLEPEILIVDEVLAVGDAQFQAKCMGKMRDVAAQGRTVLLVSHNMAAIQGLCSRAVVLRSGAVEFIEEAAIAVRRYLQTEDTGTECDLDLTEHTGRTSATATSVFKRLRILDSDGRPRSDFQMGEPVTFELSLDVGEHRFQNALFTYLLEKQGTMVSGLQSYNMHADPLSLHGKMTVSCTWDTTGLAPGTFTISTLALRVSRGEAALDEIQEVTSFNLTPADIYGTGRVARTGAILAPKGSWNATSALAATANAGVPVGVA